MFRLSCRQSERANKSSTLMNLIATYFFGDLKVDQSEAPGVQLKLQRVEGSNIHIIGAISQTGQVFWERQRGSYTKEKYCEWLRRLLRTITDENYNIVVVCDNAPVHIDLEKVVEDHRSHHCSQRPIQCTTPSN